MNNTHKGFRHTSGLRMDTPEQIEKCLNCIKPECNNCITVSMYRPDLAADSVLSRSLFCELYNSRTSTREMAVRFNITQATVQKRIGALGLTCDPSKRTETIDPDYIIEHTKPSKVKRVYVKWKD